MSWLIRSLAAVADFDPRASSKRKVDDYDGYLAHSSRTRREGDPSSYSPESVFDFSLFTERAESLHFFVRTLSPARTVVVHANPDDTVASLLEKLHAVDQRLLYNGRQLAADKTLAESHIERDSVLHLTYRMRSTIQPLACRLTGVIVDHVCCLCRGRVSGSLYSYELVTTLVSQFVFLGSDRSVTCAHGLEFFRAFVSCSGAASLVMLYISPYVGNKRCAEFCISTFLSTPKSVKEEEDEEKPPSPESRALPVVFELCKLLKKAVHPEDPLYLACRTSLAALLRFWLPRSGEIKELHAVLDLFPFVKDFASVLCKDLEANDGSPLEGNVKEFSSFFRPLHSAILNKIDFMVPMNLPLLECDLKSVLFTRVIEQLHAVYVDLMAATDKRLKKMEETFPSKQSGEDESSCSDLSNHLLLLKDLNDISKLYRNAEEEFWDVLTSRRTSVCALIVRFADRTRSDDYHWLLQHNNVTDFQTRRHLVMMMFPEVKEGGGNLHEMLIDRSNLLPESFEYIGRAESSALHASLFMEFKNEEATGPGVLREWFFLVVQAIFNRDNPLFLACPNDRRRFYPNPASKVDSMHLDYFAFSGRVIALAFKHKIQVGVVLDRMFYLQLAGKDITLEDIRDADPWMYSSCKQILEMDPEFVDSDALGLTFAREVVELGSVKVVELCPGGKCMVVNSRNREEYVNLLITHRFVTSISEQVSHFARGFDDVLYNTKRGLFFPSLEHDDLDRMLYGSQGAVCVEDWKAHTKYKGYKDTDPQILWFWQIVGNMSAEQRKVLLFFWTSIMYLPTEGFSGLASRLYIYKSSEPVEHLPSSHTCFYRLCFPPYPSLAIMQDRLHLITQEHVGCSFGKW